MRVLTALLSVVLHLVVSASALGQQPEPPPNAADVYQKAAAWWNANAKGDGAIFTEEELWSLSDPYDPFGPNAARQRAAYERVKPYIELARAAGRTSSIDRKLDYGQGFNLLLPHLAEMRNAARLLRLDAQFRMDQGDAAGALESIRAVSGIGAHSKTDDVLISSLVSAAVMHLQDGIVDEAIGRGQIDAETANALLEDLAKFKGNDPINVVAALDNERTMARTSVEEILGKPEGMSELLSLAGGMGDKPNEEMAKQFMEMGPEGVRADLDRYDAVMQELSTAMQNPDRAAATAAIDAIYERIEKGDAGMIAKVIAPAMGKVADVNWRMQDLVAKRIEMLEAIRDGKVQPSEYANAAYAYLRLAALVRGLPEESQRDLEALRVAGDALDAESVERVRRLVGPFREALLRDFRIAATCKRCEFPLMSFDQAIFAYAYLPDLRGAMRMVLADALAGPSPLGPDGRVRGSDIAPPTPIEAGRFGVRLASHLAKSPSISHGLVGSTVLAETSDALSRAGKARPWTDEERAQLAAALATVDTQDPLGLRVAAEADARRLVESYRGRHFGSDPDPNAPLVKSFVQRGAPWLAGLLLARQLWTTDDYGHAMLTPASLAQPLFGLSDVINVSALEELRTAGPLSLQPAPEKINKDFDPLKHLLGYVVVTPPVDTVAAEARAGAALATLGEIARRHTN
jgi:hypothetical protein